MDSIALLGCLAALLLYHSTLDADFVYDDRRAILSNPDLLPSTPWSKMLENDFWGTPLSDSGSHGSYRPLCVLTFRLNYILGGFQPYGYHLVNVLLHCLATALLVRVARNILPRSKSSVGPAVTGLVFATHPIHTEAVAGVVGRADLAACNFYLLSFLAYLFHIKNRDGPCSCSNYKQNKLCHQDYAQECERKPTLYDKKLPNLKYYENKDDKRKYGAYENRKSPSKIHSSSYKFSSQNSEKNKTFCIQTFLIEQTKKFFGLKTCNYNNNYSIVYGGLLKEEEYEMNDCCWKKKVKTWGGLILSIVLAIAALLSKETGITVLVVCVVYDLVHTATINKRQWRSMGIMLLSAALLLVVRLQGRTPSFSTADNPTAKEAYIQTRFLTFLYLPVLNFWMLLCPTELSFDWGMDSVPKVASIRDPRNIWTVLFYVSLVYLVKRSVRVLYNQKLHYAKRKMTKTSALEEKRSCHCSVCHQSVSDAHTASCRSTNNNNTLNQMNPCVCKRSSESVYRLRSTSACVLLCLSFMVLPFLPATNLFFYVGFVVAERVLYLPSVGLCLLFGLAAAKLWEVKRYRLWTLSGFLFLVLVFSARTSIRNNDWRNEESLYRSAAHINPAKAYGNLGSVLSSQGRTAEAEWAFKQALEHRPNMADVHYNLGVLLQGKQQLNEAIQSFQRAIHFRPSLALAYVNLGAALISAGRCQEAVSVLRQGSRLDGTGLKDRREHETARVSALLQLGALYSDQGRLQRALAAYREAAHSLPKYYPPQSVFNVLGETLARLHQDEEAERWYQAALNAQPDHVPAHITYGKLLAKNESRIAEAEQWFRRAQRLAPDDPSVYHHYGEFLASRNRHKEAANLYEKAAELRPKDYELAVAAATAMRQANRHQDAEVWYRKAVMLKPQDARGHTNLGAILHLNGKYKEAANSYREALRLQPNDVTTLTNLHKLRSVMT